MAKKRVKNDSEYAKGKSGLATFTKLDNTKARIDFDEDLEKDPSSKGYPISVSFGDEGTVPDYFPFKKLKDNGVAKVQVTLNEENDSILYINPASGEEKAKFIRFSGDEKEAPAPVTKKGKKAGSTYRTCGAIVEITDGKWKGCRLYRHLYANFGKDPDDEMLAVSGSGTGSDDLQDFLEAIKCEYTTIPHSENPLPEIQKRAQEADAEFNIVIVKGWIDRVVPAFGEDWVDEDNVDNDHPEIPDALKEEE